MRQEAVSARVGPEGLRVYGLRVYGDTALNYRPYAFFMAVAEKRQDKCALAVASRSPAAAIRRQEIDGELRRPLRFEPAAGGGHRDRASIFDAKFDRRGKATKSLVKCAGAVTRNAMRWLKRGLLPPRSARGRNDGAGCSETAAKNPRSSLRPWPHGARSAGPGETRTPASTAGSRRS